MTGVDLSAKMIEYARAEEVRKPMGVISSIGVARASTSVTLSRLNVA